MTTCVKGKGASYISGYTAGKIVELLRDKHRDDIFVPECKNGPTWTSNRLLKLDAWALMKTYSPMTTIGYEIKVSRSDFESDQKWIDYLPYCHMFYFVCPAGLIRSTDLPESVGLIWVSASGRLHTKRKAISAIPDTEKLNKLMTYILMSRCQIVEPNYIEQPGRLESIRRAVERAAEKKRLATVIRGHIRNTWEHIEARDAALIKREADVKNFTDRLARLGITWNNTSDDWHEAYNIGRQIDALKSGVGSDTLTDIRRCAKQMLDTANIIERITDQ